MADDKAPVAKILIERNANAEMWWERWKWKLWVDPTRGIGYTADYKGNATTQRKALKKAMKLVPRYVRTTIR